MTEIDSAPSLNAGSRDKKSASVKGLNIGHCRNVRGLGKSIVVFRLFEKLRYSNKRSTKFEF